MKRIHLIVILLLSSVLLFAQNKIVKGEYWFDDDIAGKSELSVTSASKLTLVENLDVNHLFDGLHTVHIRFLDDSSRWSSPVSRFFVKRTQNQAVTVRGIVAWEYWFDHSSDNRTRKEISETSDFKLETNIDVSQLFNGLHTVHIRFLDTQGDWSSVVSRFFVKNLFQTVSLSNNIKAYEYWFDSDLMSAKTVQVSDTAQLNLVEMLNVESLNNGLHTVHFRFKDTKGFYSPVVSRFFVKNRFQTEALSSDITGYEYWFDNSVQNRIFVNTPHISEIQIDTALVLNDLSRGLHTLHVRFKDSKGFYSPVVSRFFLILNHDSVLTDNKITRFSYWFDSDMSSMVEKELSPQREVNFLDSIDVESLSPGLHTVSCRFADANGAYSAAVTRFFVKTRDVENVTGNSIVAMRYWLTDTAYHEIALPQSAANLVFIDSLSLKHYPKGEYFAHIQFKDNRGLWSSAVYDTVYKNPFPYAEISLSKQFACGSDTIVFTALTVDADSFIWNFGDGNRGYQSHIKYSYANKGDYNVDFTIIDTATGITKNYAADEVFSVYPLPVVNIGDTLTLYSDGSRTIQAPQGFDKYLWNEVEGTSDFLFSAKDVGPGQHSVRLTVKDLNGCFNSDTLLVTVRTETPLGNIRHTLLKVFPNPAKEFLSLDWDAQLGESVIVRMLDMSGKVVLNDYSLARNQSLRVSHLSPGRYLMLVRLNNQAISIPVLKL
jgi:hypothetical protein